jgi:predicted GNAT family N-acyltransferase
VKLIINPFYINNNDDDDDADRSTLKLLNKVEKHIMLYFGAVYKDTKYKGTKYKSTKYKDKGTKHGLNNFNLTNITFSVDIDVHTREKVTDYMKIIHRIGKVKGFSPSGDEWSEKSDNMNCFALEGNSNGIIFKLYDLEHLLMRYLNEDETGTDQYKTILRKSKGLLRVEIQLTEQAAIRAYTDETDVTAQIIELLRIGKMIFMDTFLRIVPRGNHYKKEKVERLINERVPDTAMRSKMMRLIELVPEKKSLLLAQKALNIRDIKDVMERFADINVSPVTLSKRQDIKELRGIQK